MGWLTGSGSLARVVGPVFVTAIYQQGGIRWTSVSVIILITLTIGLFGKFWKRLISYENRFNQAKDLMKNVNS